MPPMRAWLLAALASLALTGAPTRAERSQAEAHQAGPGNPYRQTMALDQRLQDTGWRLASTNAPFCIRTTPSIGLLLQDMQSWRAPDAARAALGLSTDAQVIVGAAASGSPADEAGLRAGEPVHAIGDTAMEGDLPPANAGSYARQAMLHDLVDASLRGDGGVTIGTNGADGAGGQGQSMRISARPVCTSRFEIVTEGDLAEADGARVLISADITLELADEDQFAFVVAHELAHNILGHKAWLDRIGRNRRNVRRAEREADRLAIWLMANAGYDPQGASRFASGWLRRRGNGLFNPSHDGWDERLAGIEGEIALLGASAAQVAGNDWSRRFPLAR